MITRPRYAEESPFKIHGGCGLMGICDESGTLMSGEDAILAMAVQHDRGNGLGGGFAGYGIYPEFPDHFAFHMMYHDIQAKEESEALFDEYFLVDLAEPMPTRPVKGITGAPLLWRYFLTPYPNKLEESEMSAEDYVVEAVMTINSSVDGAFVASSGKNMGVFKGVGYPEEIGHYFRLEEYEGYTWTGHNRFPTNTPGWWGGAHPFALLDWTIVHNGEISSYGINSRYLEQFGYKCTLGTDTEVAAYLFDLLLRRHKLPLELACKALASPLWDEIDRMPASEQALMRSLRAVYGPGMLNGPFAIVLGLNGGMVALNDRIKLRPLVAARKGSVVMVASEESAIRAVIPDPDALWMPKAGEPTIARVKGMDWPIHGDLHLSPEDISCAVTGTEVSCDVVEVNA
ncbi:MAG: glutamine amidotransferase family protein [Actinomycetia bacterium]|nr:glutamine amidotransferase family protein [Actinomycetes bacterium]